MREQRFLHFASVVYNGEVYMTPQDFLNSVTQEGARGECPLTYYQLKLLPPF